jgi:hypothetical protein
MAGYAGVVDKKDTASNHVGIRLASALRPAVVELFSDRMIWRRPLR